MATGNVSGYQSQRVDYSRERDQREVQRRQTEDPSRPSPEERRAESIANKPRPAVQKLGSKIDVYA